MKDFCFIHVIGVQRLLGREDYDRGSASLTGIAVANRANREEIHGSEAALACFYAVGSEESAFSCMVTEAHST